jgi:hypothetical protein
VLLDDARALAQRERAIRVGGHGGVVECAGELELGDPAEHFGVAAGFGDHFVGEVFEFYGGQS